MKLKRVVLVLCILGCHPETPPSRGLRSTASATAEPDPVGAPLEDPSPARTASDGWAWVQPQPQASHLRAVWASDDGATIVAVGDGPTIVRSGDAGATWRLVELPPAEHLRDRDGASLRAVASLGGRLVAAGRAGTWVSADLGITWKLTEATPIGVMVPASADEAYVLASGEIGVGDGRGWDETGLPDFRVADIAVAPGGALLAAGEGVVARSEDRGATWTVVHRITGEWLVPGLVREEGAVLLTFIDDGGDHRSLRSDDGGTRWSASAPPRRWDDFNAVARAGEALVGVGWGGRIRLSHDGGATWRERAPTGLRVGLASVVAFGDGVAIATVIDHGGGVLRTTNGGATWKTVHAGDFRPAARWGERAIVGGAGEVAISADAGRTWRRVALAAPLVKDLYMESGQALAISSDKLWRSRDEGLTWTEMTVPVAELTAVAARGAEIAVAGGNRLMRTRDGGASWKDETVFSDVSDLAFSSDGTLAVVGRDIATLPPAGPMVLDTGGYHTAVAFAPDGTLIVTGGEGVSGAELIRSVDGGATWERDLLTLGLNGLSVGPDGVAYVVGNGGAVLRRRLSR